LAEDAAVDGEAADLAVVVDSAAAAEEDLVDSVVVEVSAVAALADPGDTWLE